MGAHEIGIVEEGDLEELLPLMRAYCDFYEVGPSDADLLAMSRVLIDDPERQGLQLIARDADGEAVGFATIFWTWSTLTAARLGVMNDLFVSPEARGTGLADALIEACAGQCRRRGVESLEWQTASDNHRAQAVYDRVGGDRSDRWLDYSLAVSPGATTPDS
ncbi:MAG: GNAT family N-acetyltransferase [Thermoleophilaceae bacterium]|nr:GNAT family N-acetyltransferase [Thermoleophilaceae bacterium]